MNIKKIILNIVVLTLVFAASVSVTGLIINREKSVQIHDVSRASLPVVYMQMEDMRINPMFGYANAMEQKSMRDSITPLSTNRKLQVVVDTLGNEVESVEYEISTADGSRKLENGLLTDLKETDGALSGEFKVENPILMNQEYTLCFKVTLEKRGTFYYYTRLLQRAGTHTQDYLDFVEMFYRECTKADASAIMTYIEPDSSAENNSYHNLNIHSSYEMLSWGDMNVNIEQEAYPVIKDLNEMTCSIAMRYVISDKLEDGTQDYYNVEDFYRMRYGQARVMLLNFERETEEIFDSKQISFTANGLNLGITDKAIDYASNGKLVAFVQEGELWAFERSSSKVMKIFSFRTGKLDMRENLQQHDIKIVRVSEDGDIDFVVYGYMNCDDHEGEVGIGVYHYDEELNQIQEKLFIPVDGSYEYLKDNMGNLSYVTTKDFLYLLLENTLYKVDINEQRLSVEKENLKNGCFVISKSQENIAWHNEMLENGSSSITVMNLESGKIYEIAAGPNEKIKALGFINEDFVYGLANDADIQVSETGETIFAMHTVKIAEFGGEIVKEYRQSGIWVYDVNIELGLLELLRVEKSFDTYIKINSDHIMNNSQSKKEQVELVTLNSERKAAQVVLEFKQAIASDRILYLEANMVNRDKTQTIDLGEIFDKNKQEIYYVYDSGKLDSTWTNARDAILRADAQLGVVLNSSQQYVWERGNKDSKHENNLSDIPEPVLAGTMDEAQLASALGENYKVMNLAGCTLEQVLYFVGHGNPVLAKVSDEVNVVIIGYNNYNTILYDPRTGKHGYYGINDSTKLFAEAGNVFVGCMETLDSLMKR